jgi:hypothetical protein
LRFATVLLPPIALLSIVARKLGLKSLDVRGRPELVDCPLVAEDGVDLGLPELQEAGRREGVG